MGLRMPVLILLGLVVALSWGGCSSNVAVDRARDLPEGETMQTAAGSVLEPQAEGPAPRAVPTAMPAAAGGAPPYEEATKAEAAGLATPLPEGPSVPGSLGRKIIKDGELTIEVDDLAQALSRIEATAVTLGGYVLETSTSDDSSGRPEATVRFAVPSDRFETALQRVRQLARRLVHQEASGIDVTQEYVDLQSEIASLEVTQARLRKLMEQARYVEESLQVNAQLMSIETEIAQRKGRLQYLAQRSAFSTINVRLLGPKREPTVTPTPTPVPPWQPGPIVNDSLAVLQVLLQGLATVLIQMAIVLLPLLAIIGLPLAVLWWLVKKLRASRRA